MKRKYIKYMADFETTVFEGQTFTEVWAAALVEIGTGNVSIYQSIDDFLSQVFKLAESNNIAVYFHNLKFDGSFIIDHLLNVLKWSQAFNVNDFNDADIAVIDDKEMKNKTFKYLISDMGQWYTITLKYKNHFIEFRDSLKLLPFSVKEIGNGFDTKHKKSTIEYTGFRFAGCTITDAEKEYIKNDVFVVAEALDIMFKQGHDKLTIGSCCLAEYKKHIGNNKAWREIFPDLTEFTLDSATYGADTADAYIRKSYRGGWCYVVKGKENKLQRNGVTIDVNSLYPSMMSSESGNFFPIGLPKFWRGNMIPEEAAENYFFIRFRCSFKIKRGYLPFVQIKNSAFYRGNENLTSSEIILNDKKYSLYNDEITGGIKKATVILTMTQTDYYLFLKHYDVKDFEILDGCYFAKVTGIFDSYINKYKALKVNAKTAPEKKIAKLYLNNLYGKMATNTDSTYKYAYVRDDESIGFIDVPEKNKKPIYIPAGSAITSYSRNFTIQAAQANYYGPNKSGFIYADTDSIHCDLSLDKIKGVKIHDSDFCAWKHESTWDEAIFARQKTYIEHIITNNGGYYDLKCAGLPQRCKDLFIASMTGDYSESDYNDTELQFIKQNLTINDFKRGLIIPTGKLLPKRIRGGTILVDSSFEMR